ncbi:E3 ubiquitin-protein ligase RHF2A [Hibiscus syriacus]|uniref:RING-type E3 ubiquitin transferase n=1 Tax=Hibiscus syriacus TaxID=106335 RepID=A0A6A2WUF0_HIBSY|nr:E3 ubiquitin-protein ligase RHF2A [Hibiscus syriacus]
MEDAKSEAHLTSASAFVEGGIQDACSICLEEFCESDPSTMTSCKHEFHLQCVLECFVDAAYCYLLKLLLSPYPLPSSKDFIEEQKYRIPLAGVHWMLTVSFALAARSFRFNPSRNATIFYHPTSGNFDLHLPVGANEAELEERIMQHFAAAAAAAAMGRARHIARREGPRNRSSAQARPRFLVVSSHPNAPSTSPLPSSSPTQRGEPTPANAVGTPSSQERTVGEESSASISPIPSVQADQQSASASGSSVLLVNDQGLNNRYLLSPNQSPNSHDRAGPPESLKSKFNAASVRYKVSISKSTRGWKERFFSRNTSLSDLGSQVRREVNAGIATVSRMMERLETRDNRTSTVTVSNSSEDRSNPESNSQQISSAGGETPSTETSAVASCATSSASK